MLSRIRTRLLVLLLVLGASVLNTGTAEAAKSIRGTVKLIDLDVGTITLQGEGNQTYNLASKDLKVVSSAGQVAMLSDVVPGARVLLTQDELDIVSIRVEAESVWGVITAVDAKANTFAIRSGDVEDPQRKFGILDEVKVMLDGKPATFADVKAGQRVRATLSLDGKSAVIVNAGLTGIAAVRTAEAFKPNGVRLKGYLLDLDKERRTVQLMIDLPTPLRVKTYEVDQDAVIRLKYKTTIVNERADLIDLAKTLAVTVYIDSEAKTVVSLDAEYPIVGGILLDYDQAKRTLTVEASKQVQTLTLAKDAKLFGGGKPMNLDRLPKGKYAVVALTPDRSGIAAIFLPKVE